MPRLEDYALIGDCETAALVSKDGAIDWLCFPAFDGRACFAALVGTREHGTFQICPRAEKSAVRRAYVEDTMVLDTHFETEEGAASVIDFMPLRDAAPTLVRTVVGRRGRVSMKVEFRVRFDYGSLAPYLRTEDERVVAIGGPDGIQLHSPVALSREDGAFVADFTIDEGDEISFVLSYFESHLRPNPAAPHPRRALDETVDKWRSWAARCATRGPRRDLVVRSLLTLKALTYRPTGAIVAAPTTSLPEQLGGVRNWDYRHCWLRDATFTLYALLEAGYRDEAAAWRDWLVRAVAGEPSQIQIMYGLHGERRLPEVTLDWLPGYADSRPVRIGNDAHRQRQLDIHGEVIDMLHLCRDVGLPPDPATWELERGILDLLEGNWREPDHGIWEVRGRRRRFVHSQVMAWVAFDRAVKAVTDSGLEGPVDRWRAIRAHIHEEVCARGFNADRDTFVQYFDADAPDASLLMIPLVGFLPPDDPRVRGTLAAIERELVDDGLVGRYTTSRDVDGLPEGEGKFILCSLWLADNYILQGRLDEARALFNRVAALANDVGLLAEAYDTKARVLVGNFPQAFSHIGLVNTARNLAAPHGPAEKRAQVTATA